MNARFVFKWLFFLSSTGFFVIHLSEHYQKMHFTIGRLESFLATNWMFTQMYMDEFCVGYNYLNATNDFREDGLEPVSLALHSSSDMMRVLEDHPENWDGPISIALFVDYHSQDVLEYVAKVHKCDKKFREKVTLHFVTRLSALQTSCPSYPVPNVDALSCKSFSKNRETSFSNLYGSEYQKEVTGKKLQSELKGSFQLYPINVMRNVARRGAKSDIHFIVDADMIMSENFANRVKKIANQIVDGKRKQVLVVRRFEAKNKHIPKNVQALKQAIENKTVFEFHHVNFFVGHRIADLPVWFNRSKLNNDVTSWEISYTSSAWEVQVIVHRNDKYNADYSPPRLLDMQTLVYSLCRANYTFNLLSHVFNVHEGIKTGDTPYSIIVADYGKKFYASNAFKRFREKMDADYPETLKKCGKFQA